MVEPNLDLLTYSIWPLNLDHVTLKRAGFPKIKTQNHCLGYPKKILSKRNLFSDLYWVQVSALMVSVTHGSAGITAICSMCPVTPACGMPNIYAEAGGREIFILFSGNEKLQLRKFTIFFREIPREVTPNY